MTRIKGTTRSNDIDGVLIILALSHFILTNNFDPVVFVTMLVRLAFRAQRILFTERYSIDMGAILNKFQ